MATLLPIFQDLIKPQWRAVIETLKLAGGLPVNELSARVGASYMAVKQQCEDLRTLGYLRRIRIPRSSVGRPEIFYHLAEKSENLFPQAGMDLTLDLLAGSKALFGESAADKLLFQHFERLSEKWQPLLARCTDLASRAERLAGLRENSGCRLDCRVLSDGKIRLDEFHNPMKRIFEAYPRAVGMEQRMIESLVGCRVLRMETEGPGDGPAKVSFELIAG